MMTERSREQPASITDVLTHFQKTSRWQEHVYKQLHAELGYEVLEGIGRTGVIGVLRNGPGPTVLARADMDALPVNENTGLPYASLIRRTEEY